jgi:hypothetical protein
LSRARDADPTRTRSDLVFEGDDEVTATREDSPEGFLRSLETEHAFREPLKLALTELRLLDVELDDRGLHGFGGPIPGSALGAILRAHPRTGQAGAAQPLSPKAPEGAARSTGTAGHAIPGVLYGKSHPKQTGDHKKAGTVEAQ